MEQPRLLLAVREQSKSAGLDAVLQNDLSDWHVHRATTRAAVQQLVNTFTPELILVDSRLPADVAELCRVLRNRSATAYLPIIVVEFETADPRECTRMIAAGADDCIELDDPPVAIARRIRSALRTLPFGHCDASGDYADGRLSMNLERGSATLDGNVLRLTRIEYALLRCLVQRRNSLISRQELINGVWGDRVKITSRTVDVHLSRLRRKLGSAACRIQTLNSRGYRFNLARF
jgi:two-component system phosphate regulon response regulator PhoB